MSDHDAIGPWSPFRFLMLEHYLTPEQRHEWAHNATDIERIFAWLRVSHERNGLNILDVRAKNVSQLQRWERYAYLLTPYPKIDTHNATHYGHIDATLSDRERAELAYYKNAIEQKQPFDPAASTSTDWVIAHMVGQQPPILIANDSMQTYSKEKEGYEHNARVLHALHAGGHLDNPLVQWAYVLNARIQRHDLHESVLEIEHYTALHVDALEAALVQIDYSTNPGECGAWYIPAMQKFVDTYPQRAKAILSWEKPDSIHSNSVVYPWTLNDALRSIEIPDLFDQLDYHPRLRHAYALNDTNALLKYMELIVHTSDDHPKKTQAEEVIINILCRYAQRKNGLAEVWPKLTQFNKNWKTAKEQFCVYEALYQPDNIESRCALILKVLKEAQHMEATPLDIGELSL